VKFICKSYTLAMWKYEDGSLPFNARLYIKDNINNVLEIKNIIAKNSGKYTCLGQDKNFFMFEDNVYLTIRSKSFKNYKCHMPLNLLYLIIMVSPEHYIDKAYSDSTCKTNF